MIAPLHAVPEAYREETPPGARNLDEATRTAIASVALTFMAIEMIVLRTVSLK